ncbi:ATPase, histidine kinase-, DNA gyrase B-, and HSP90-like domain protein [Verrucomicrobiia bacterium DG1235]|nr:ATPase, histidine kinase-, DNA gyrase B-, and HSP90-like domain protein [Verrucomicrobiae bacterium DG1235]
MKGAQASAWVTYLLLALGIVVPVVCVLWLVRDVVDNENELLVRLIAEADTRSLEDAEREVRESVDGLLAGGDEGSFRYYAGKDLVGEEESERARATLAEAREELAGLDGPAARARIAEWLNDEALAWLRLRSGRSVGAILIEMGIGRLVENETPEEVFLEAADAYVVAFEARSRSMGQLRYLAKRYVPYSDSQAVAAVGKRQELAEAWLRELGGAFDGGYFEGLEQTEDFVFRWDKEKAFVHVFEKADLRDWILGIRVLDALGVSVLDEEGLGADALVRRLAEPLDFVVLGKLDGEVRNGTSSDKAMLYFWVGGIVLGLSLLSGSAIVISLKRQTDVAQLKDSLVATVTHELKTPVSSIRLLVDTLQDESRKGKVDEKEYVALIARENQRLGRLIDNFLSFSRMERGMGSFAMEAISAASVVGAAEEAFRDRFQGQNFELEVCVEEGIAEISGDGDALATVLGNLLENAFKYGGKGRRIVLRAKGESTGALFEVEDYGMGIAKKEQRKIFRKFYQVSSGRGSHAGSVGLGLSIVEFIVSKHSGRIDIESELGRGSIFKVRIPYA